MANSTGRRSGGGGRVSLLGDCGRGSPTVSARSGGSGKTTHTLAAMSAGSNTSAVSMHPNSYSYLSDRVYDYGQAESMWMERVQDERRGQGRETIALKVRIYCLSVIVLASLQRSGTLADVGRMRYECTSHRTARTGHGCGIATPLPPTGNQSLQRRVICHGRCSLMRCCCVCDVRLIAHAENVKEVSFEC